MDRSCVATIYLVLEKPRSTGAMQDRRKIGALFRMPLSLALVEILSRWEQEMPWALRLQHKHSQPHQARSLGSACAAMAAKDRNLCLPQGWSSTKNRHPLALAHHQQLQSAPTARANHRGWFLWWCRPRHSDAEHKLHEQDQTFGIAMQEPKVPDTPESFGQDMKHRRQRNSPPGSRWITSWPVLSLNRKVINPWLSLRIFFSEITPR